MRKYSIIILFFFLPFFCLAQDDIVNNDNEQKTNYKNQIDLEADLLGTGFGYNRRVFKNWFVGVNVGVGFSLVFYYDMTTKHANISNSNLVGETLRGSFLLGHNGVSNLKVAFGFKVAHFWECPAEDCSSNILLGVGFNFFYGKNIQIGFKSLLGFYETNKSFDYRLPEEKIVHQVFSSSLLVLRIPVKW